ICKRSEEYFRKRYQYVHNALNTYYKYQAELNILSEPYCYQSYCQNGQSVTVTMNYIEYLYRHNSISGYENPIKSGSQQNILDVLLSNRMEAQYLKQFCYAVNGI